MQYQDKGPAPDSAIPSPATATPVNVKSADTSVRLGFLRKVYALLTINFGITIGLSCLFAFVIPVRDFVLGHSFLILVALGVALASLLVLACIRLKFPTNLLVMYVFVLSFSFFIATIVANYFENGYGVIVLQAFVATAAVFLAITAFVFVTKKDFSFLYGFLGAGLVVLIVLSLLSFVVVWGTGSRSKWFIFGISVLGALLMTGYLLYDTSMIMTRYGPDDWLIAVISLYVDVTQLFLYLLNIFSIASN